MTTSNDSKRFPESEYPLQFLTGRIIAGFREVYHTLGYGFVEPVYRRALTVELQYRGLIVAQEVPYEVVYRGVPVGLYRADQVVEEQVIIEVKTGRLLDPTASTQLLNYLKASGHTVGLVLYFGPKPTIKRVVNSAAYSPRQRLDAEAR